MPDAPLEKDRYHHDVFISYAQVDKPIADAVCAKLESRHIRCWISPRDVSPGKDFPEAIIDGIEGGRVVVLIFSSHANNSPHVIREMTNAVNRGRIIIPFRIEDVLPSKSMEYLISVSHWLDAVTPPMENHIEILTRTVECVLGTGKTPAACLTQAAAERTSPPVVAQTPPPEPPLPVPEIPQPGARPSKTLMIAGIILIALIAIFIGFQTGIAALPVHLWYPGQENTKITPTPSTAIDYRSSDTIMNTVVLTTAPTQTLAKNIELYVTVNKDDSNAMVTVQFNGGPGVGLVKENRVILTRSDGTVTEEKLNFNQRLSEVQLQGSRGTDRLQVIITLLSGERKSIVDTLLPYRQYR